MNCFTQRISIEVMKLQLITTDIENNYQKKNKYDC